MVGIILKIQKWIYSRAYNKHKEKLDNYVMGLDYAGLQDLRKKMDKFVESLKPEQLVFYASFDLNKTFGELAYYKLMNFDENFKKEFMRHEIEAIKAKYVQGFDEATISRKFARNFSELDKRYIEYCTGVYTKAGEPVPTSAATPEELEQIK